MKKMITLTKVQISQLSEICEKFPTVPQFDIWERSESGIGSNDYVKFEYGGLPISIDVTDVSNW